MGRREVGHTLADCWRCSTGRVRVALACIIWPLVKAEAKILGLTVEARVPSVVQFGRTLLFTIIRGDRLLFFKK